MLKIEQLTDANFFERTSSGVVLIDFWAPWCGPCKMLDSILEEVSEEIGTKALIAKVNIDEFPDIARKFGVRSIPAIFLMKDGKQVTQFIGLQDKNTLIKAITGT